MNMKQKYLIHCMEFFNYRSQLDVSTARRHLKSPRSLSCTSAHPTMFTQRSRSWYWMIDSHPFCSMSIGPSIPEIRLFQTLTLEIPRWRSWVRSWSRSYSWPSIQPMHFLFVSHQPDQPFLRYANRVFDFEKNTSKVKKKGKSEGFDSCDRASNLT